MQIQIHIHTHIHLSTHRHTHIYLGYIQTCTYTHKHTHTHLHTNTHTHSSTHGQETERTTPAELSWDLPLFLHPPTSALSTQMLAALCRFPELVSCEEREGRLGRGEGDCSGLIKHDVQRQAWRMHCKRHSAELGPLFSKHIRA